MVDIADKIKVGPRTNRFSWDELFMSIAMVYSQRSPDPSTQVGACIVDDHNNVIATGYNGLPRGCDNNNFPWEKDGDFLSKKYAYIMHAEANALVNCKHRNDLHNGKIYVTLFPCNECAKQIIASGISEVVYMSDKYKKKDFSIASRMLFDDAKVKYRQFSSEKLITLDEMLIDIFS